ncbi:MAG: VOC family protein [Novosphingobium sp.]
MFGQPVRQIAYVVDDVRKAAEHHHALFGSGPFFVRDEFSVTVNLHGEEVEFLHSVGFGQWGSVQIELLQAHDDRPSILNKRHPFGSGTYGMHHVAVFADDLVSTIRDLEAKGFPLFFDYGDADKGLRAVMMDTWERHGHFLELYQKGPFVDHFYDMVEEAAKGFQGEDLIRPLKL